MSQDRDSAPEPHSEINPPLMYDDYVTKMTKPRQRLGRT